MNEHSYFHCDGFGLALRPRTKHKRETQRQHFGVQLIFALWAEDVVDAVSAAASVFIVGSFV